MIRQQLREFFVDLFLAGRFIPKIEALAKTHRVCPNCHIAFQQHPRNHHLSDKQISVVEACIGCGEALTVNAKSDPEFPAFIKIEYPPCQDCFPGMSAGDFPDRSGYSFSA